ncbi:helix-hairpin-helix domain-containing protein [Flammeovirgaceae bacterium SG7u.111]|nr:helix-hairpin-helix domain-containing protein [Flammeovirgaceae bacterium SG7u.132]WPO33275.1 helix-hairpin-helix domain-containing protein [Flammeovirgaceae bacterium SG7u.111]
MNELLFIIAVLSVAFIIGYITAWAYFRNLWSKPLRALQAEDSELTNQMKTLRHDHNEQILNYQKLQAHSSNLKTQLELSKNEADNLQVSTKLMQEELEQLRAKEDLVTALNYEELSREATWLRSKNEELFNEKDQLMQRVDDLEALLSDYDYAVNMHQNAMEANPTRLLFSDSSEEERDDLKKINGIGPFIEQKLNNIGIWTYRQISEFDDETVQRVTLAIAYFPGRIERDDWVGQAKRLIQGLHISELMFTDARPNEKDDLKTISGIGPFIEKKLNEIGIRTYRQICSFDEEIIEKVAHSISSFPGRIQRDDWVGQARTLYFTQLESKVETEAEVTLEETER